MDDKQKVRKHFAFLLNYILDNSKKAFLSADDLVMVSNEVHHFKNYLKKADIDPDLKEKLDQVHFDYSPARANFSSSFLIIVLLILSLGLYFMFIKIQELERKRSLVAFLDKYEDLLKLF